MSRAKDFSNDLEQVSKDVNTDVDAILQIVRQRSEQEGESVYIPVQIEPDMTARLGSGAASIPPKGGKQRLSRARTATASMQENCVSLENVTTRLRRDTNELLTEAALRQRLKKKLPATRQDIMETALQDWLRKHGYSATRCEHE
jgi:hypothetical protein